MIGSSISTSFTSPRWARKTLPDALFFLGDGVQLAAQRRREDDGMSSAPVAAGRGDDGAAVQVGRDRLRDDLRGPGLVDAEQHYGLGVGRGFGDPGPDRGGPAVAVAVVDHVPDAGPLDVGRDLFVPVAQDDDHLGSAACGQTGNLVLDQREAAPCQERFGATHARGLARSGENRGDLWHRVASAKGGRGLPAL